MNLLIYTRQEVIPSRGGIERVAKTLADAWASEGHSVSFLCGDHPSADVRQQLNDHQVQLIINHEGNDLARTQVLYEASQGLSIPLISLYHFSPTYSVDLFRASWIDLLHSGLPLRSILSMLVRNTGLYRHRQLRYFGHCNAQIYAMSDAVVLLSERQREAYLQLAGITEASRLHCIPNLLTLQPPDVQIKQKTVLYVARLTFPEKRPDLMLQIWAHVYRQFPDWQLKIIGEGDYRQVMEHRVATMELERVQFLGQVDAAPYYTEASIVCMTSNSEGFGLVLSEAAAYQAVPMCFDSFESARDIIVDGETGFIVPHFDVARYADCLARLMRDETLRQQMATAARLHVNERFAPKLILARWNQLFSKFL